MTYEQSARALLVCLGVFLLGYLLASDASERHCFQFLVNLTVLGGSLGLYVEDRK